MKKRARNKQLIVPSTKPAGGKAVHELLLSKKNAGGKHKTDRRPTRARMKELGRRNGGLLLSSVF